MFKGYFILRYATVNRTTNDASLTLVNIEEPLFHTALNFLVFLTECENSRRRKIYEI